MTVAVSYPGVYVQEVSSGVRTIVGVSTSIGLFIGRAKTGQIDTPTLCNSYEDFVRAFSADDGGSDMMRAVKLFFANGGQQCWAMRVAKGASSSTVTLRNAANDADALQATALSAGLYGDSIRLAVSYDTQFPEATFNLTVFAWTKTSTGALRATGSESYVGLSMDPASPRYAIDIVNAASRLVALTDPALATIGKGWSQAGFAVSTADDATFRTQWMARLGAAVATNRFLLSVDGNAAVEVDLSAIDFTAAPLNTGALARANLATSLTTLINSQLPAGATIAATMEVGPAGAAGQDNAATTWLRITSQTGGDVTIDPASAFDLAVPLMLGTAQGGVEVSRFANARPAPTGWVSSPEDLATLGSLPQTGAGSIDTLIVNGVPLDVSSTSAHSLATTTSGGVTGPVFYEDATAVDNDSGSDGIREKLAILAAAINDQALADSSFAVTAEVWGSRLAILPTGGIDNGTVTVATNGPVLSANATSNVRFLALGASGLGAFQSGSSGLNGIAPDGGTYQNAYQIVDREVDLFNILVLPKDHDHSDATTRLLWGPASIFCQKRRAFLIMDPPDGWISAQAAVSASVGVNTLRVGLVKDHSAVYFPRLKINENGKDVFVGPSGAMAGLFARIDGTRGVWKAPAGTEATLQAVTGVESKFSDGENGALNPKAVNTIRVFPEGIVSWGARTLDGDDSFGSEYKYVPIRRLALFIEESLYRGLKWVVFEPNDAPLWAQIRLNVGAFMNNLFQQGAFQGAKPGEAYFVKCDASTTTPADQDLGIVNIVVGFAPLKPAEFVILTLQQIASALQT